MTDDYQEQRTVCPLRHAKRPDDPPPAAVGAVLCAGHIDDAYAKLELLATFDSQAIEAAHDTALTRKAGAPISGDRERPLPQQTALTQHSRDITEQLASWTRMVAEERRVHLPLVSSTAGLCAFLRKHHSWSVSQPWADDYANEVLDLGRRAWSLLHPKGNRRFTHPVMRCINVDMEADPPSRCPGQLWAYLTPDDDLYLASSSLICDSCEFEATADEWLTVGRRLRELNEEAA